MINKIVVGMSGGVDSSMTLLLLKKQGWQPIGVSLKLSHWKNKKNALKENICCSAESFEIARSVCKKLNVPYHIFDVSEEFEKQVINYFISDLKKTRTPNPCIICNRYLKFKKLFEWAKLNNIEHIATGHYAKIILNKKTNKYELHKSKDKTKDQSYGLCFLPQKWLRYIKLPLGDYTKEEIYKIAKEEGFEFFLKKKQSQDLCFVSKKALPIFIEEKVGLNPGNIVNTKGEKLGKHKGLHFYTIGQKRKLYLPGTFYVKGYNINKNELIVTKDLKEISQKEIFLKPYNLISGEKLGKDITVMAKVGYGMELSKAVISILKNKLIIKFVKPKPFVRAGQFCVFFQGSKCLGGGVIN